MKKFLSIALLLMMCGCTEPQNEKTSPVEDRIEWIPEPDKALREEWEKQQLKKESSDTFDWVQWDSISIKDQNEVELFWMDFSSKVHQNNKDEVIQNIHFPLDGEWGFILDAKKTSLNLTSKDFKEGYNIIFNDLVKTQISNINMTSFDYMKSIDGGVLIGFRVGVSLTEDTDEFESSRFFTFYKTNEGFKLGSIYQAG